MSLTVTTFLTLDGVMQAPGGPTEDPSGGFTHGGWQAPLFDDDCAAFETESIARADAFLLGRRTYEIFAGYWPKMTDANDPVAGTLNRLPKHVASRTRGELSWKGSELVRDVVPEVKRLKERYARELQVFGSAQLVRTLFDNGLIDDLHLFVHPVVLGSGIKLFETGIVPTALKLAAHHVTKTGTVIATYRLAGKPKYGSLGPPME